MPKFVVLEEQGPRDGFQSLKQNIPTDQKIEYIEALVDAGLSRIQVCSFVHPKLVPQMADAEEVFASLKHREGVIYSALVLNTKGVERAAKIGLKHLSVSLSASDAHSRRNANKGLEESKAEFVGMVRLAHDAGIAIRGGIQCAFGCRYEGRIPESGVLDLVKHHLDLGVEELALADSTGMANPLQMRQLMTQVKALAGDKPVILHLHNTENKGLANVYAALEAGIDHFDTAFGALGGCPFIKSATGNIGTEDTAHMLGQMGIDTGVNIKAVARLSQKLSEWLGYELPGRMHGLYLQDQVKVV